MRFESITATVATFAIVFCSAVSSMVAANEDLNVDLSANIPLSANSPDTEKSKKSAKLIALALKDNAEQRAKQGLDLKNADQLKRLKRLARISDLHKRQANFIDGIASGKFRPFPDIVKNYSRYTQQVAELVPIYQRWSEMPDSAAKDQLQAKLLHALQPLGYFLHSAEHGDIKPNVLSKQQVAQQNQLDKEYSNTYSNDSLSTVRLLTQDIYYTLKHIPIEIQFAAPEGTEIMLDSDMGGIFSNKLSKIKIIADKNNLATAYWHSFGDAVAMCSIRYKSKSYPGTGIITPIVKQLKLHPLDHLSPIPVNLPK